MKKSSNIKSIRVNEEKVKKVSAIDFDLKTVDIQEIIRLGLREFMFERMFSHDKTRQSGELATSDS